MLRGVNKNKKQRKKNLQQPTNTIGAYLYILYTLGSYTKDTQNKKEKTYLACK